VDEPELSYIWFHLHNQFWKKQVSYMGR
jgi:hypothetical protein